MRSTGSRLVSLLTLAVWFTAGAGATRHLSSCPHGQSGASAPMAHHAGAGAVHQMPGHPPSPAAPHGDTQGCSCPGAWCCPAAVAAVPTGTVAATFASVPATPFALPATPAVYPPRPRVVAVFSALPPPSLH